MNSPGPASPSTSTPSSGSPPPEEASSYAPATGSSNYLSNLTSHITATLGTSSSSSKRRLPTGSSFGAASRDSKTRKRADPGRSAWGSGKEPGAKKDDLLDPVLVDYLRRGMSVFSCHAFNVYT